MTSAGVKIKLAEQRDCVCVRMCVDKVQVIRCVILASCANNLFQSSLLIFWWFLMVNFSVLLHADELTQCPNILTLFKLFVLNHKKTECVLFGALPLKFNTTVRT